MELIKQIRRRYPQGSDANAVNQRNRAKESYINTDINTLLYKLTQVRRRRQIELSNRLLLDTLACSGNKYLVERIDGATSFTNLGPVTNPNDDIFVVE